MMDANIFTKIADEDQKNKVFDSMIHAKSELVCKGQGDDLFKLLPSKFSKFSFHCRLDKQSQKPRKSKDKVVVSCSVAAEKYFFYGELFEPENGIFEISVTSDLYKLQRRQSYRLKIPASYKTQACIRIKAGKFPDKNATILDISTGGTKLYADFVDPKYVSDQIAYLDIKIGNREVFTVDAIIRHVKPLKVPIAAQELGIQFEKVSPALESKLFAITMELHRELFAHAGS